MAVVHRTVSVVQRTATVRDRRSTVAQPIAPAADRRVRVVAPRAAKCDLAHKPLAAIAQRRDRSHVTAVGTRPRADRVHAPSSQILKRRDIGTTVIDATAKPWCDVLRGITVDIFPPVDEAHSPRQRIADYGPRVEAPPPVPYQIPDTWQWNADLAGTHNVPDVWNWIADLRAPRARYYPIHRDIVHTIGGRAPRVSVAPPDRQTIVLLGRVGTAIGLLRPGDRVIVIPLPVPVDRHIVPFRKAYLMLHDIRLLRVSDSTEIPFSAISVSADANAWADTFTATCHGDQAMDLLTAAVPEELELQINGTTWRFIAANPRELMTHGNRSVALSGHSLTALLHVPYTQPSSGEQTQYRNIAQLAEESLPAGQGWTLTWSAQDWGVIQDAWRWRDWTPMQRITYLAAACDAVIRPDRSTRNITVQPRWPVLPWNYGTVTPDLIIADGLWLQLTQRDIRPEQANSIHVQGGQVGGVQAHVYRDGSAGDINAPIRQHDLVTHQDGARALGASLLAAQAQSSRINSLILPFDGSAWPLAQIGQLVSVERWGGVRDTIQAVGVSARVTLDSVSVTQRILLGADSARTYVRLQRVFGSEPPLRVAEVLTDHGDETVTVSYPGGGTERIRGTANVGQKVWARAGLMEGLAPDMPTFSLTV